MSNQFIATRTIECWLPTADDATEKEVLRLTVSSMNILQHRKWQRLLREAFQWSGVDTEEEKPLEEREIAFRRAGMLAALKVVERGVCALDADGPTEWQKAELPQDWQSIEGVAELPWELVDLWWRAAVEVNPGVFIVAEEGVPAPGSVRLVPTRKAA